ncbi:hypothetical protein MZM54_03210 [[Brevibacterium] frigoritolerans]|nr:hypothetical protein [Peribacillus frigoritolerans]
MRNYLVALCVDEPSISYSSFQIIESINKQEAINKYNEINKCSYFYGTVLAEVIDVNYVNQYINKLSDDSKLLLDLSFNGSLVRAYD